MKVITIGRSSDNDIVINDTKVSRHHLQIIKDDRGNFKIFDFGSVNGTFINGRKISGEISLNNNDILRIGNTTLPWQNYFSKNSIPKRNYNYNNYNNSENMCDGNINRNNININVGTYGKAGQNQIVKSKATAALLCFFLGVFGIHRFYLGYEGIGVLELLTGGCCGILSFIDFIRILIGSLKPYNGVYDSE